MFRWMSLLAVAVAMLVMGSSEGQAQATRTWVSGVGDDANPCSRTAPCRTFASAISKTQAGGQISVLDPGGFGAVTITKSISIVARGVEGSALVSGTNGININAGPNDEVTLDGLTIEGLGTGTNGVRVVSGRAVHINNCLIRGFQAVGSGRGIAIEPNMPMRVNISDCMIVKNQMGVRVSPQPGGRASVVLNRVTLSDGGHGIRAERGASTVFMSNSVISGNNVSIGTNGAARVVSFGNNVIVDNKNNKAPTETLPLQ